MPFINLTEITYVMLNSGEILQKFYPISVNIANVSRFGDGYVYINGDEIEVTETKKMIEERIKEAEKGEKIK